MCRRSEVENVPTEGELLEADQLKAHSEALAPSFHVPGAW